MGLSLAPFTISSLAIPSIIYFVGFPSASSSKVSSVSCPSSSSGTPLPPLLEFVAQGRAFREGDVLFSYPVFPVRFHKFLPTKYVAKQTYWLNIPYWKWLNETY